MIEKCINAALAAVAKAADKTVERESLEPGAYSVSLRLLGEVDGSHVEAAFNGSLRVNEDSVVASSSGPDQSHLLALMLAKLNAVTRDKILRELPDEFAAAGNKLPEASPADVQAASQFLKRLRSSIEGPRKGSVSYRPAAVSVS